MAASTRLRPPWGLALAALLGARLQQRRLAGQRGRLGQGGWGRWHQRTMAATPLLKRGGVGVFDYRCTAGPRDTPYVEQHRSFSISYVRRGSFGCRTRGRAFELVGGSFLLGRPGDEYLCTHEHHAQGDECLSYHFDAELLDTLGLPARIWRSGALPPLAELAVLGERAQAAAEGRSDVGLDEAGVLLAARFIDFFSGQCLSPRPSPARD